MAGHVAAAAILVVLAGCLSTPASMPEDDPVSTGAAATWHVLDDPPGDAYDLGPAQVAGIVASRCLVATPLAGTCMGAVQQASAGAPGDVGRAGHPEFDIHAVDVEAQDGGILVRMTLGSAAEGLAGALPYDEGVEPAARWIVCWNQETHCVGLWAWRQGPVVSFDPQWIVADEACIARGVVCAWTVPMAVQAGAPGALEFTIPYGLMGAPGSKLVLADAVATAEQSLRLAEMAGYWADAGGTWMDGRFSRRAWSAIDDAASPGVLEIPVRESVAGPAAWLDEVDDVSPSSRYLARLDMDLVSAHLEQGVGELRFVHTLSVVEAVAGDHDFLTVFQAGDGPSWFIGFVASGGEETHYAWRCFATCETHHDQLAVRRETGAPGVLTLALPRDLLGEIGEGDRINLLWTKTLTHEASGSQAVGGVQAGYYAAMRDDWTAPAPYAVLQAWPEA